MVRRMKSKMIKAMTTKVLEGKQDTKNPNVRFDEGKVASSKPRGGFLLYTLGLKAALLCATGAAFAAEVGDSFLLQTKSTTMAFQRNSDNSWDMIHYGAKVANKADAEALAWNPWIGGSRVGQRRPAVYSVFGDKLMTGYKMDAGENKFGGLAVTHADGCLSTWLENVKTEIIDDKPGVTHLVITQKDRVYPFYVTQHFRAMEVCDVIETWVELHHDEPAPVKLMRMASIALDFPLLADKFYFQYVTGQSCAEAQIVESEIPRGQTASIGSRSGVRDAWEANASFMLSVDGKATETSGRVIGGALCWSGAWNISVQRDQNDFVEICAGSDTSQGAYTLDPGRTIVLPKFALTYSAIGKGQISRNIHRWARDWQLPAGHKLRPVLLNSWEGSFFSFTEKTLHDMMDGVKEMGGELFVLDDGWFGLGKYARDNKNRDKAGLGDWFVNPEKLPNGLTGLYKEATTRGLKFGFWVEPEMANTKSHLVDTHPDWVMQEKTRPLNQGRGGTQVVLDYTNPQVRDAVFKMLDDLYRDVPDVSYIKWDANADFMNIGSTHLDANHQANLQFDYTIGLYKLLAKVRAKYPDVDIQACSSGGGRVDYGFLRYADEFWSSDDTDARERVFIQWGENQFYPACLISAHVTVVPSLQTHRSTPLKYRFDVAMSGRLGFELHPKNLSADDLAFAKKAVADYKRIRPVVQQGDLYRLVSPYENSHHAALMYVSEDRSRAVVFVWGLVRGICKDYVPPVPVHGLDAARKYTITEINVMKGRTHSRVNGKALGGDALSSMGLPVKLTDDYDSAVFELTAE